MISRPPRRVRGEFQCAPFCRIAIIINVVSAPRARARARGREGERERERERERGAAEEDPKETRTGAGAGGRKFQGRLLKRALNDTLSPFGPLCSVTKFNALPVGAPLNLLERTAGTAGG
jgi:hypothetical protein